MNMRPATIAWLICATVIAVAITMLPKKIENNGRDRVAVSSELGGEFTLVDQDGKQVGKTSWPGQYLLLYFGFAHCPDVCPLGLNKIADALNALPAEQANKIQPIFITVDPARDTAAELKPYVALFHPRLVGLTGTEDQIEHVKKLFKVYAQKQGDGPDYMVNHSSFTYLIAPDHSLAALYSHDTSAGEMAKDLQERVSAK